MSRLLSGLLALLLLGCPAVPSAVATGQSFRLAPGERATLDGGAVLAFVRVAADSRCPRDVVCVRAGEVIVEVAVDDGEAVALQPGESTPAGGVDVELVRVEPYPTTTTPIQPSDYRATFRVSRRSASWRPGGATDRTPAADRRC